IDTSHWFESQLPPAAEQPEAKIEMTSLGGPSVPHPPSIAEATQEARELGTGVDGAEQTPPEQ
ncbi:MAG TPA: SPFH/Band 7/PHB domain protein, partial [Blastococcus sp.]|nr:SPFH/Band 7/PHB domain protein [Blastococcus sp.]